MSFSFPRLLVVIGVLVLLATAACDSTTPNREPSVSSSPEDARIVTSDVERFWAVVDGGSVTADRLDDGYFAPGTAGLKDFAAQKNVTPQSLSRTYKAARAYYQSTRTPMQQVRTQEAAIRAAFVEMKERYADAQFPAVYFVVGQLSAAGRASNRGLLIAAEMVSRPPDAPVGDLSPWLQSVLMPPEAVPHLVAHELIHYQQRHPSSDRSLLRQSIVEGAADFLAEKISGAHVNDSLYAWAEPREAELWAEFQTVMMQSDYSGWLYDGSSIEDRPADLGYWMGYQIVAAYYDRADDKTQAVREILTIDDFEAFLTKSGYAPPPSATQ